MSEKPPPDDETRRLVLADPDDPALVHLAVVGDTYTFLVTGKDTAGRYALIDMLIPDGGGPPPHRHDFEEMFHVLEGAIEVTLRDTTSTATAGQTVNVPANAPHRFHNASGGPVRLLCMVSPAGLEEYFTHFGDPLPSRTSPAPELDAGQRAERMEKAVAFAPQYGIENL
jgi:quercetin dioxygenase-like cupin family protein